MRWYLTSNAHDVSPIEVVKIEVQIEFMQEMSVTLTILSYVGDDLFTVLGALLLHFFLLYYVLPRNRFKRIRLIPKNSSKIK